MSRYNASDPGRTVYSVLLNPCSVRHGCARNMPLEDAVAGLSGPNSPGLEA